MTASIAMITKPHMDGLLCANAWCVQSRGRNLLVDTANGVAPLRPVLDRLSCGRRRPSLCCSGPYGLFGSLSPSRYTVAVLTITAGLLAAFSYATSDLLSQRVTRRTRPLTQVVWVQATGVVIALPLAALLNGTPKGSVEWHSAGFAALSGVAYFGAFYCLLQGLRVGDLGLVSALKSMEGAYAAVVFVLLGAIVTPLLGIALTLCVFGAVLASMEGRNKTTRGAAWALASGLFFAGVMVCYRYSGDIHWLSQAAISRGVSLAIALPIALLTGSLAVPRSLRTTSVMAGVLELFGVVLLTTALSLGPPTVAGVTAAQVGTFALLLGVTLLHERPQRHQWVGVACTILGVSSLATLS